MQHINAIIECTNSVYTMSRNTSQISLPMLQGIPVVEPIRIPEKRGNAHKRAGTDTFVEVINK